MEYNLDFTAIDITALTRSTGSGECYLELFLKEYASVFQEKVNPSCPKCLTTYLDRYKNHFKTMTNTCNYRLYAKYENIPLEFGSPILINNANITDEYAQKLLEHTNGERYFSQLPKKPRKRAKPKQDIEKDSPVITNDTHINELAQ